MTSGIYKIINIINGDFYIGQSTNIERRTKDHLNPNFLNPSHLARAIRKYGKENFSCEILETCCHEELNSKEYEYIVRCNPKYNVMKDHKLVGVIQHSEETKKTISEKVSTSMMGNKHSVGHGSIPGAVGKHRSEETRRKISEAQMGNQYGKGRVVSDEVKAKMSANMKGRSVSEEARAKISASQKGRVTWMKGKQHSESTKAKMVAAWILRKLRKEEDDE
jgi:group I intron endonuclease